MYKGILYGAEKEKQKLHCTLVPNRGSVLIQSYASIVKLKQFGSLLYTCAHTCANLKQIVFIATQQQESCLQLNHIP